MLIWLPASSDIPKLKYKYLCDGTRCPSISYFFFKEIQISVIHFSLLDACMHVHVIWYPQNKDLTTCVIVCNILVLGTFCKNTKKYKFRIKSIIIFVTFHLIYNHD